VAGNNDNQQQQDDAIASGHGAYLMEEKEDEPNIFTVNVGNLPPGKSVDIAITYVTELEFDEGQQLRFRLPSNNDNPSYKAAAASSNSAPNLKLRVDFGTDPWCARWCVCAVCGVVWCVCRMWMTERTLTTTNQQPPPTNGHQ
jgi:hypothetical protein